MNDTLIDLYRGVQKHRGEWKAGDRVWHGEEGKGTIHEIMAHRTARVAFDRGTLGIGFHLDSLLWLPPVWSDDGRCLYDMIERDFSVTRIWYDSDDLTTDDGWIYGVDFIDGEFIGYYNSLPEALLRAIREQDDSHE